MLHNTTHFNISNISLINTTITNETNHQHSQNPLIGLLAVITACFLSGFAGIYFEKILKNSDVSLWLRNVQLATLSIPIGIIAIAVGLIFNFFLKYGFNKIFWVCKIF